MNTTTFAEELKREFTETQSYLLAKVIVTAVEEGQQELVKTKDFKELKDIVARLAQAQERTAQAQERTEQRVEELASIMQELARETKNTRTEVGGLGKSMGYALENEAFRNIPAFLEKHHHIVLTEKLIRQDIKGQEINMLGKGKREGKDVIIVGEATLRLDQRDKFAQLEENTKLVAENYPGYEVIPLMITHYARKNLLELAQKQGILVIQSFEWA